MSRRLADALISRLEGPDDTVVRRTALEGLPVVTGAWVAASFADGDPSALTLSDALVDELLTADEVVLVAPVYDFGVPAAMKARIDQVVRAGRTFSFTPGGPVGLTQIERGWIVTASGGTPIGSALDFDTTYLRTILEFIGGGQVEVIAADQLQSQGDTAVQQAMAAIDGHCRPEPARPEDELTCRRQPRPSQQRTLGRDVCDQVLTLPSGGRCRGRA